MGYTDAQGKRARAMRPAKPTMEEALAGYKPGALVTGRTKDKAMAAAAKLKRKKKTKKKGQGNKAYYGKAARSRPTVDEQLRREQNR